MSDGCCTFGPDAPGASSGSGGGGGSVSTVPEAWGQENIAASQTGVALSALVSTNFDSIRMIRAGSIVGLASRLTANVTQGTLTVTVSINGIAGTLTVVSTSGSNQSGGVNTQADGIDLYAAGDFVGILITTTANFLPITSDVEAWLQIMEQAP